jgi:hypothetical protein
MQWIRQEQQARDDLFLIMIKIGRQHGRLSASVGMASEKDAVGAKAFHGFDRAP